MEKKLKEVLLICVDEHNIETYLSLFSPALWHYLHVSNSEDEKEYILQCLNRKKRGVPTFLYLIYEANTNVPVGAVQIRLPHENKGQLYCWINEQYWGQGYLQPAILKAAEHYFNETDLNEFSALVYHDNVRSFNALKKVGFIEAGTTTGPYGQQHVLLFMRNIKGNV